MASRMTRTPYNPVARRKIQPPRTRSKGDIGSRNNFTVCTLTKEKSEIRSVERWENQRTKIRAKSSISGRISRNFHNRRSGKMSQTGLIGSHNGMPEGSSRDLVILEVGPPGDTWRYSIERDRFAEKSEWFRAMLLGDLAPPPSDPPPTLPLQYVDKRAFDHLLTYLRGEPLNFHSVSTARSTLDVAHQLLCPELALLAVRYITANLSASNVLDVYRGLSLYVAVNICSSTRRCSTAPSAPPSDDVDQIAVACSRLLSACHAVIDAEPDDVLRQENFEDLSASEVAELASRDDLRLRHEGTLFDALDKWATCECKRRGLEPTPNNRRAVLDDDIWYSVRYLLMTSNEFIEGPMRSGVLSPDESAFIATRILGHNSQHSNRQAEKFLLSHRLSTTPRNRKETTSNRNYGMKPGKKEREDNKRNRRKECANQGQKTCARIGDCIVRVLACVFD